MAKISFIVLVFIVLISAFTPLFFAIEAGLNSTGEYYSHFN